jgi:hypothetical protein
VKKEHPAANTVKTTAPDWLQKAIKLYAAKKPFTLVDDADLGIVAPDLKSAVTLIRAAKRKGAVSWQQIAAVLAGICITGIGVWMMAATAMDGLVPRSPGMGEVKLNTMSHIAR